MPVVNVTEVSEGTAAAPGQCHSSSGVPWWGSPCCRHGGVSALQQLLLHPGILSDIDSTDGLEKQQQDFIGLLYASGVALA